MVVHLFTIKSVGVSQALSIEKAQAEGKFVGRKPDLKKRASIASLLAAGHSYTSIQNLLGCSRHLISDVKKMSHISATI